jgi:hypothetical protein
MATSVFKGPIDTGEITARFLSDFSNLDSDLLGIGYAETGGGNPQSDHDVAAPGSAISVALTVTGQGILEVFVAIGHSSDTGRLSVSCNGQVVNDEPVQGSIRWTYAVIPE